MLFPGNLLHYYINWYPVLTFGEQCGSEVDLKLKGCDFPNNTLFFKINDYFSVIF